jgi:hypothetical protein
MPLARFAADVRAGHALYLRLPLVDVARANPAQGGTAILRCHCIGCHRLSLAAVGCHSLVIYTVNLAVVAVTFCQNDSAALLSE